METKEFIPITVFCTQYEVPVAFLASLREFGLIEVILVDEIECIHLQQLEEAEKMARLYADLQINPEGIDVISHLLEKIKSMQEEIQYLKNRLNLYE